jgi:plasmid maintenance system antidote protein VapI
MTTETLPKTKLRTFLDERGLRYIWVAERLGISKSHLGHIMDGRRPLNPTLAERIGELFDVDPQMFEEYAHA